MTTMARTELVKAELFFRVSPVGTGVQDLGLSSAAFPAHKQEADLWQLELELSPIWDAGLQAD